MRGVQAVRKRMVQMLAACVAVHANGARAGDFVFGDDFEPLPNCGSAPTPSVVALASPAVYATTLGTTNRYQVKMRSCGYVGAVALTTGGAMPTWSETIDPPNATIASG